MKTMNGPEHFLEAQACIHLAAEFFNQGAWPQHDAMNARAQVHATLALAAATMDAHRNGPSNSQEFADWRLGPLRTSG